ncbi:hypothetical protein VMA_002073 [Vibrio mimicus VM223]|nr:hypothetical protein VMA_002073 [Vibrio mimicus VM223]
MPEIINNKLTSLIKVSVSPNNQAAAIAVPTAPIPTQMP